MSVETETKPAASDVQAAPEVSPPGPPVTPKKKKMNPRKKKRIRNLIIIVTALLLIGGGVWFGVNRLFFTPEEVFAGTGMIMRSSLMNTVQGYGVVKPVESADIAVKQSGTVLESYVTQDDIVAKGDPLFLMDSATIDEAIANLEKEITGFLKEIVTTQDEIMVLEEEYDELLKSEREDYEGTIVQVPFDGKLINTKKHKLGDEMKPGDELGLLVNDKLMRLTLYFSYAYENDITEGMTAEVSIPQSMSVVQAKVDSVEKIRRITPQGTVLFEVRFAIENPGALTRDMDATASLKSASGELIVPAEAGKLEYWDEETLYLSTGGRLTEYSMRDYYEYKAGQILARVEYIPDNAKKEANLKSISAKQELIAAKQESIASKQAEIDKEKEKYDTLLTVAPIDGTVRYNRLSVGEKVDPGTAVISIANMSMMVVEGQIDERDIGSINPGMAVNLEQWTNEGVKPFMGTVDTVSMEGKNEYGMTFYPAVIKVDNFDGQLLPEMGVNFTINTDTRENVLVAPVDAVKNTALGNLLFVQADAPPEGAIPAEELPPEIPVPNGFYAVLVNCGMGNTQGIEILEPTVITEGMMVFTQELNYDPNAMEGGPGMNGGMVGRAIRVG